VLKNLDTYLQDGYVWFKQTYPHLVNKQSLISHSNMGCMNPCPSMPADWVFWPATAQGVQRPGLPVVGVGFIYHQGYFVQDITGNGWQETRHFFFNFNEMPIISLVDEQGIPLVGFRRLPGGTCLRASGNQSGTCISVPAGFQVEQNNPPIPSHLPVI